MTRAEFYKQLISERKELKEKYLQCKTEEEKKVIKDKLDRINMHMQYANAIYDTLEGQADRLFDFGVIRDDEHE